ncbi:dynein heavy chain, N-terminal region 2-domain-containing protein [Pavlovales sp. CCMP2436]|nr:dynein heavy chain, N-terminal region 2-domain-containing protein [Pavlovales sp. CCMP2436]
MGIIDLPATAELRARVDDALADLDAICASRFGSPFESRCAGLMRQLAAVAEVLDAWVRAQAVFVRLAPLFGAAHVARSLPKQAKVFEATERAWSKLLRRVAESSGVVALVSADEGLRGALEHVLAQLETCARALSGYLHSKRLAFARLGFVGDGALLEILAQAASEPHAVLGRCLPTMFAATAFLELCDERSFQGSQGPVGLSRASSSSGERRPSSAASRGPPSSSTVALRLGGNAGGHTHRQGSGTFPQVQLHTNNA